MSIVHCPSTRTATTCLDANHVRRTHGVHVGGSTTVVIRVMNAGATSSPPITILLFTFEPPFVDAFITPSACNGCTISKGAGNHDFGLEWPAMSPGVHDLKITIRGSGRPANGMDQAGAYEWIFAAYAEPFAAVDAYGPLYTSAAFGLGTGATVIAP
jgi:hypothetical protein